MLLALQRDLRKISFSEVAYSDEFLVLGIFAIFGEHAKEGLLAVESLANFVQSFHKT